MTESMTRSLYGSVSKKCLIKYSLFYFRSVSLRVTATHLKFESAESFCDLQEISNENEISILRVFRVPGHGKGDGDHVGEGAYVALCRMIEIGIVLIGASDMVDYLLTKFQDDQNPSYLVKEIDSNCLQQVKDESRSHKYHTVYGLSKWQVILFLSNATTFKAAPWLCICAQYQVKYGLCSMFLEFEMNVANVNQVSLRSDLKQSISLRKTWIVATLRISFCQDQLVQLQLLPLLLIR